MACSIRFAPYREVSVEFARHQTINAATLAPYGDLQSLEGCKATFFSSHRQTDRHRIQAFKTI